MEWLESSRKLIHQACSPWGIKASLTSLDNYNAIFTRDAVMAGIVGILLKDNTIITGLKNTLINLKKLQGTQGQIPSNFTVNNGLIEKVSYGTLSPKIDSCTWYLVGVSLMIKGGFIEKENYKESTSLTISLLDGIEYNGKHLLYIPKGGNWADEYVYEGYILYDQILRAWGLTMLAQVYKQEEWQIKSDDIKNQIKDKYKNDDTKYYNSSFYPGGICNKFDLAAHSLAGLIFEKENSFYNRSLDWVYQNFSLQNKLPPAFYPVINQEDEEWEALSKYHLFGFKNKPNHYHNGGIWWIWLGWLAISLSICNKETALNKLCESSFDLLSSFKDFDFEEYVSADELIPNGTKQLCYTATGLIMLTLAQRKTDFSILKP